MPTNTSTLIRFKNPSGVSFSFMIYLLKIVVAVVLIMLRNIGMMVAAEPTFSAMVNFVKHVRAPVKERSYNFKYHTSEYNHFFFVRLLDNSSLSHSH